MARTDYRVWVTVSFFVDLGAESSKKAGESARQMVREVFSEDFSRAEDVCIYRVIAAPVERV